ncbi:MULTISPECIES: DUF896 domain-containing protein [Lactobacillus]|uniref:UPF0291 protein HMPREF0493_0332 n=1 Tax=Lactobacillus amylolyticus DSM 11664 TaxID=585524 RepID=D4YS54_9LACO|nr:MULTISPECIES: DUF896 domain-containing protein [Lactobacillus]ARD06634.1 DUF896 family protein [Lactobacillus amylolyticus]EFG55869.1 hypothetical protein HMPREF0493_0332 [Lactobacillus amylolyticus DSM 11664]KRL19399.1 hypothetical protein FD39_GL000917 [Lactobacillus amylolyticus DSM 11664]QFY04842.1 DUF896 domain-containing protein [Lactobacillus amylolyticus]TDG61550.1 hypothetical protein C5L18_000709 [Lactobacillus amylolyticus]
MDKDEIKKVTDRINELYHKKENEGLTPEEEAERKELHKKFLANFRAGFKQQLEDTVIIDKDGNEVTSERAKRAQRKKGLRKD